MAKKVLIGVSENGFWIEELLKPLDRLNEAGIEYDFLVPTGKHVPFPDGASLSDTYVDPPLGRPVTAKDLAERGKKTDWEALFANHIALSDFMPLRPYLSSGGNYLEALEKYYVDRAKGWERLDAYDALLLAGGSGPVVDMANNNRLHDVILPFSYRNHPTPPNPYTATIPPFAPQPSS